MICGACAALTLAGAALPSLAGNVRLPPLSQDPARCERAYVGNTIGQVQWFFCSPGELHYEFFCAEPNFRAQLLLRQIGVMNVCMRAEAKKLCTFFKFPLLTLSLKRLEFSSHR
jgi:hypothetical protein